ncbi:hypothetical protein WJX84_003668 [Apatococcus fuscideae]|uniref:Uncharacterized protein n=1 Tax=Apatococcus fuscideae TaxID=2026836 RepID=A0AAW1TE38_9CHLO
MGEEQKRRLSPLTPVRTLGRGLGFTARQVSRVVKNPFARQENPQFASSAAEAQSQALKEEGPLEKFRLWNPFRRPDPSSVAERCFPRQLCRQHVTGSTTDCQDLLSIGCRNWGNWWDGRSLLRVKLYDFAVYMDGKQIQQSQLSRKAKRQRGNEPDAAFFKALRGSDDISMSLMVRAARNLPIPILAKEYERILKRRLQIVGGSANDAALTTMLECFKKERLPSAVVDGNTAHPDSAASEDSPGNAHGRTGCIRAHGTYEATRRLSNSRASVTFRTPKAAI